MTTREMFRYIDKKVLTEDDMNFIIDKKPHDQLAMCLICRRPEATPEILTKLFHMDYSKEENIIKMFASQHPNFPEELKLQYLLEQ